MLGGKIGRYVADRPVFWQKNAADAERQAGQRPAAQAVTCKNVVFDRLGRENAGALQQLAVERLRICIQQARLFALEGILHLHHLQR